MPWTLFATGQDAKHARRAKIATFWLIVLTALNLFLAVRGAGEGDRIKRGVESNNVKFCAVISTTINALTAGGGPVSAAGKRQLKNFQDLYKDFECPGRPEDYR